MARQRMVTRTVLETVCEVMTVDVTSAKVENRAFTIQGTYEKTEDALVVLKKSYETDTEKLVTVVAMERKETLYGMLESDFIRLANVLPPRGSKANEDEDEG